jgi:hypothetical protein
MLAVIADAAGAARAAGAAGADGVHALAPGLRDIAVSKWRGKVQGQKNKDVGLVSLNSGDGCLATNDVSNTNGEEKKKTALY